MKNLIDSSLYFSVITEDSLMQTILLDASLAGAGQTLISAPGAVHVLQEPEVGSLEETLVASRSGDDLLLVYRGQEVNPVLTLEQFFVNNGQLRILHQGGELSRGISADEHPQQGALRFSAEPLGTIEQQAEAPALVAMHQAVFTAEPASPALMAVADAPLSINSAKDALGGITGDLYSGDVTDDKFAPLQGSGPAGAILEIVDGTEVIGEVQVAPDGSWNFEQESALAEGGHVFTARVKGSSETSEAFALIIDSIAPPRVIIEGIYDNRDGLIKLASNTHTSDSTPFFKGTAEKLSVVEIYNGKTLIGTARANSKGEWTFAPPFTLPDGDYSITAKASDYTGNTGLASTAYKFSIDTLPPAVPTILKAYDDFGDLQGDLVAATLTDDRTPTLSGKAEVGVTVLVYGDGKLLGTAAANPSGDWSFTPPANLLDGLHSFTATARDKAGNTSGDSDAFELTLGEDRTHTPTLDSVLDDIGTIQGVMAQGSETDDARPTLKGTAQPGDRVQIFVNGTLLDETVANNEGIWSYTPTTDLADGTHTFKVQALNDSSSPSELSSPFEIVVDTIAPDASSLRITGIHDDVGSVTGNVALGARTDDRNPTVSGTGTDGNTITLYVTDATGRREVGKAWVVNGTWSMEVTDTLSYGQNLFTAVESDAAGNTTQSPGYSASITTNDGVGGFDLAGNQSSSAAINSTVIGYQNNPQVTKLANGNLVVVWQQSVTKTVNSYDVVMQIMDPTGKYKIGGEQLVNQRNIYDQDSPQVVALADGGFLIVFESNQPDLPDNSGDGVYARRYSAEGAAQTDEFLVNQTTAGHQRAPSVLDLPDGGYIIAWTSDQSGSAIMQRVYDANNQPIGNEQVIKAGSQSGGAEMELLGAEGWYITVWSSASSNGTDVFGQLRKIDGSKVGPVVTLNTTQDAFQNYPDVITLKDGSFVVFWDSNDSKSVGSDIRAAHYSVDPVTGATSLIGNGDFIVNQFQTGKQYKPVGVALEDGGYMLIWGSEGGDGDASAIYAQRFDSNSQKIGHEFLVNPSTWGNQGSGWDAANLAHILDATLTADGNIFVTWHSDKIDPDDYGIEGVTLDIDAGFYSEFTVNSSTANDQRRSSSSELPDGGFIVVWESWHLGNADIMAQQYDESGMPVGKETTVNTPISGSQGRPNITTLKDGSVIVTWQSNEGGTDNIRIQRYTADSDSGLTAIGEQARVNVVAGTNNREASVVALDDGGYMLAWVQASAGQWSIMARQYDKDGLPSTPGDMLVAKSNITGENAVNWNISSLETLSDGRLVIAYSKIQSGNDIAFKIYDPANKTLGSEVIANENTSGNQTAAGVAKLNNGNFVVTWDSNNTSGPDQSGWGVWARVYTPDGIAVGKEFLVNTYTPGDQKNGYAIARPDGGFIVIYESAADTAPGQGTLGIYAQFFDDAGNRIGQEMRIHQLIAGDQQRPDVVFLEDGRMFVTWTDYGVGDGSGSAVKGRIIDIDTTLGLEVTPQETATNNGAESLADDVTSSNLWMLFDDGSASGLLLDDAALSSVRGGAGNDLIAIKDTSFALIDGGDGIDTLLLDSKNMSLDLDALVNRLSGIEIIDLGQGGSNSLSLSADALEGMGQADMLLADGNNQLVINGDGSNSIQLLDSLSDTWMQAGETEVGGVVYQTYVSGSTELLIEQSIQVSQM